MKCLNIKIDLNSCIDYKQIGLKELTDIKPINKYNPYDYILNEYMDKFLKEHIYISIHQIKMFDELKKTVKSYELVNKYDLRDDIKKIVPNKEFISYCEFVKFMSLADVLGYYDSDITVKDAILLDLYNKFNFYDVNIEE